MVAPMPVNPSLLLYADRIGEAIDGHRMDEAVFYLSKMYACSYQLLQDGVISSSLHKVTSDFYFRMISLIIDYQTFNN